MATQARCARTPRESYTRSALRIGLAASLAATVASAQPERTGLHKTIPPLRSTYDTLGFFPPAGSAPSPGGALGLVTREVAVRIDTLNFPLDEALDIALHHGACIDTLIHGLRTGGANFRGAVFVDTARVAVDTGAAPFTGEFSPAHPLAQFDGGEASGLWILEIYNHSADRMGILEQWGVAVTFSRVATSVGAGEAGTPRGFSLSQNYPNPFNPSTMIRYILPARGTIALALFNALGQRVMTIAAGVQDAGEHEVRLDASGLPSGIYFYRLQAGSNAAARSLAVVK